MLLLIVKMNLLAEKHTAAGNLVHRLSPKLEPGWGSLYFGFGPDDDTDCASRTYFQKREFLTFGSNPIVAGA